MTPEALWGEFCAATGHAGEPRGVDQFGDDPGMADELLALVLAGTKRATCCLARDFADTPLRPGDHWIITDGDGLARAITRTDAVEVVAIREVTEEMAWTEGEGDRSLAYWKAAHDAYFERQGEREGFDYDDAMLGLFERFTCVWPV